MKLLSAETPFIYTMVVYCIFPLVKVECFSTFQLKPLQSKSNFHGPMMLQKLQLHLEKDINEGEQELCSNKTYTPQIRAKIANSIAKGERRANERNHYPRPLCTNCCRPPQICVCEGLPSSKIKTNTYVLILQHPNEFRKKNFSTVPLLKLVLQHTKVKLGYSFDYDNDIQTTLLHETSSSSPPLFVKEIIQQGRKPLLLFPGPDAISLGEDSTDIENNINHNSKHQHVDGDYSRIPEETKESSSSAGTSTATSTSTKLNDKNILILIDGTWSEARRMIRNSPTLVEHCQQIQFTDQSSATDTCIYNAMRKEPEGYCLSTLEACAQTLQFLEPTNHEAIRAKRYLNQVLQTHVDAHLANSIQANTPRRETSAETLYIKNKRRREIESHLFKDDNKNILNSTKMKRYDVTIQENLMGSSSVLKDGSIIRPLKVSDASIVDSWWDERSSTKSHSKIARLIMKENSIGNKRSCCCLGIEGMDGKLRACILRYEGGALGMLHVDESYRRLGYGHTLLAEATKRLEQQDLECVAFIVDGNHASETLFTKQGWTRADPTVKRKTGRRKAKRKWIKQT